MPLETQGFGDLENDLTNMAAALEFGSGVDRALLAGAKPIEEQMLHNASTDPKIITGALHDSIHTGKVKKRRLGGKAVTIGVHHAEKGAYYANPTGVRPRRACPRARASLRPPRLRYPFRGRL